MPQGLGSGGLFTRLGFQYLGLKAGTAEDMSAIGGRCLPKRRSVECELGCVIGGTPHVVLGVPGALGG